MSNPKNTDLFSGLRKDILQGKYQKGYKLTEHAVCFEYEVSRTPVREAFHRLEAEGLIETVKNRGAFVLGLSKQDMEDIFALRKPCEIQAVIWAIERVTDEELDALEEAIGFMELYTGNDDAEKVLNLNSNFHQLIYKSSHSRMLQSILSSFQLYAAHERKSAVANPSILPELLAEHKGIFNAIKIKDVALGINAMENHMDNAAKRRNL